MSAGVGRHVQGPVRRRLGRLPREDPRAAEEARHRPAGHRADRAPRSLPGVGHACPTPSASSTRDRWRSSPGSRENADWNVGRLLDDIEDQGDLDNTLVFYIWGDNGASMEGTHHRIVQRDDVPQRRRARRRAPAGAHRAVRRHRGAGRRAHRHRTSPRPGRTPTTRRSSGASRWPATSAAPATRWWWRGRPGSRPTPRCATSSRTCIDVAPTVLQAVGVPEPTSVDGIEQEPMDGTQFLLHLRRREGRRPAHRRSTSRCSAAAPSTRTAGGPAPAWTRRPGTSHRRPSSASRPGSTTRPTTCGSCTTCPTTSPRPRTSRPRTPRSSRSCRSCSGTRPSATGLCRCSVACRCSSASCRRCRRSPGSHFAGDVQNIQRGMVPRIYGRSYAIEADLVVPDGGAEGVIVANADFIGGYSRLGRRRRPAPPHVLVPRRARRTGRSADRPLPTGDVTVRMLFTQRRGQGRAPAARSRCS